MELNGTVAMMSSQNYQERFKAEYFQLKIRLEKLADMLREYKAGILKFKPSCSYELLFEQFIHMKSYMSILQSRAHVENIDLTSVK